jgi:hypothetical protein
VRSNLVVEELASYMDGDHASHLNRIRRGEVDAVRPSTAFAIGAALGMCGVPATNAVVALFAAAHVGEALEVLRSLATDRKGAQLAVRLYYAVPIACADLEWFTPPRRTTVSSNEALDLYGSTALPTADDKAQQIRTTWALASDWARFTLGERRASSVTPVSDAVSAAYETDDLEGALNLVMDDMSATVLPNPRTSRPSRQRTAHFDATIECIEEAWRRRATRLIFKSGLLRQAASLLEPAIGLAKSHTIMSPDALIAA